ncbi:MAG: hypothetical protein JWR18_1683 [Segetibacter sp.]|nr:hypothetical protein [Segetibacter sp.]
MKNNKYIALHTRMYSLLIFSFVIQSISAQQRVAIGSVLDPFTQEKIPYASVQWKKAGYGTITDSIGNFRIATPFKIDTLQVTYVGFEIKLVPVNFIKDSLHLNIQLGPLKSDKGVFVKTKSKRGLIWWQRIVSHKPNNDPYKYDTYKYELYNKVELDLNNINRNSFNNIKLLKPFGFILDNVDSVSEKTPFLPVFFTETLSDYYYTETPHKVREIIKAASTKGIKNETVLQFMGGANQKINSYNNYIMIFGKEFISPLSNVGDKYYRYQAADTQTINNEKYFHLFFSPLQAGENTFSGECLIHSTTWAIKKITMDASSTASINFVKRLSIVQEFKQYSDSTWILLKDKFVAEISPLKKDKLSFIGRKTSIYNNTLVNDPSIHNELKKNSQKEEVIIDDSAKERSNVYWDSKRLEPLGKNELKVLKLIDTLENFPLFKKYTNAAEFIVDGRKKLGKIEIGPWFRWFSGNQLEKLRMRFDLATTQKFSKSLLMHGYLAYGVKTQTYHGKADVNYRIPGSNGVSVFASYTHDLDNGKGRYNDEDVSMDNMFTQLIRRPNIKQKFIQVEEIKASITKEWKSKFSTQLSLSRSDYETFQPLPHRATISKNATNIINAELGLKLRYAPGEKSITTHRRTHRLKGFNPVYELKFATGIPGITGSDYRYEKLTSSISQKFRIPRWGNVNYYIYGGKIFGGPLPFMLLELHPGNEIYYYNRQAFNLMNRFEYFSDQFVGINMEHNFDKKLLNLLPFMRKVSVRQFWNVKAVNGSLSDKNRKLNRLDYENYKLRSLKGNTYVELGTGLENIFRFLRIDFVWRFAPQQVMPSRMPNPNPNPSPFPTPISSSKFGVFASFRFKL